MKKLALVTVMSLILTACGSGGGSSSADSTKPEKIEGVLLAFDFEHPIKEESTYPDGKTEYFNDYELAMTRFSKNNDINHILINSVSIALNPNGDEQYTDYYNEDGINTIKVGKVLKSAVNGKAYKYMRFGIHDVYNYNPEKFDEESYNKSQREVGVFVQGYATENMPSSGIVTYKGDAYGGSEALTKGESRIDVDFGHKTLVGTLSDWQDYEFLEENDKTQTITFGASIKGNQFDGKNVKGAFFGHNAAEIGGIYYDKEKGECAVFGAKKQ
ncbi:Transferrin binding protein-like solute binding protein [Phocoenobacter uteri]|uniref:Transferrin binding protein-like solute binding protein n=1 Tax=Phocoenobacter uteri TaxID=146806 RepID=A0A379C7B2_9PAST|nr:transferrin-binding protein-like solute binding protein [Phocoenobacter uteri]MDG6882051.1 hypothetical protein [Phocoenobacter uteri]SUB58200.1 Transferrin binding protein-like solute binding protein [Phocoenobacter uteri]